MRSVPRRTGQLVADPNTVRSLTANVYQENTRTSDVLKLIKEQRPDLILLLETSEAWKRVMQPIEKNFPHNIMCPLENMYGLLFYSRFLMLSHELRFLIQEGRYSIHLRAARDGIGATAPFLWRTSHATQPN